MKAETMLSEGIELINSLAESDPNVLFAMHMCRGNYQSMWMAEGGYESIAADVFKRATHIGSAWSTTTFEVLSEVPADKTVVLGLVSSKTAVLEPAATLKERIEEASHYFSKDQLAISTQCGFASVAAGGNALTQEDERAKLELVASVARAVWG
jgi:5-methyltetrahydropteroyltriglutamate--homocysteine methyltransferase